VVRSTARVLTIRREQIATLGAPERGKFVEQILPYLSEAHPAWFRRQGAEGAQQFVERAIDAGDRHRIIGRQPVLTFIELLIEFGESFERSPEQAWAQGILSHATLPDGLKLEILSERLRALTHGRTIVEFEG
jgi:hypothetical protein